MCTARHEICDAISDFFSPGSRASNIFSESDSPMPASGQAHVPYSTPNFHKQAMTSARMCL